MKTFVEKSAVWNFHAAQNLWRAVLKRIRLAYQSKSRMFEAHHDPCTLLEGEATLHSPEKLQKKCNSFLNKIIMIWNRLIIGIYHFLKEKFWDYLPFCCSSLFNFFCSVRITTESKSIWSISQPFKVLFVVKVHTKKRLTIHFHK